MLAADVNDKLGKLNVEFHNTEIIDDLLYKLDVTDFGTLVTRLILKKKWNMRHTSHPYQNFSKVYSHSKMAKYLIIYHLIWLCPLLVLGNYYKEYVIIFSSLSLVPSLVFLIKFGPLRSSL